MSTVSFEEKLLSTVFEGASGQTFDGLKAVRFEATRVCGAAGLELIDELLQNCTYISTDKYSDAIYKIAEQANSIAPIDTTVFCATAHDRHKDSSQMILVNVHAALAELYGYKRIKELNRCDKIINTINTKKWTVTDVIFVDEFVGTGDTAIERIKEVKRTFLSSEHQVPKIHFIAVAGMHSSHDFVNSYADSVYYVHTLKKGIGECVSIGKRSLAYKLMDKMEDDLHPKVEGVDLPRLGYKQTEALYGKKLGNCPNNVIPMFWWPLDKTGNDRAVLFRRAW